MAELEEDDIGNPVSENFEISQESDDTAALSPVQSDCVCFKFVYDNLLSVADKRYEKA